MPRTRRLLLALVGGACLAVLAGAPNAAAETVWLCKPGLADNPCLDSLTTTVIEADGSTRTERTKRARRPKIDCFYVYPTVSGQPTPLATRAIDPEIRAIAAIQASRFASVCRPFAPVYRQFTITGIGDPALITFKRATTAFGDVARAWKEYLAKYNHGRGVVLISHSQGTYMMRELMSRAIDSRRSVRRRLVSGLLLGGNVTVREGADRGGDFEKIRACRRPGQIGCVIAYSTYYGAPPVDTRFGEPGARFFGAKDVSKLDVLCTDPTRLAGDGGVLRAYFPTERMPGPLGLVQDQPPAGLTTPWVSTRGLYRARCAADDNANWLAIADAGGAADTRFRVTHSIGADWGLHLVDLNLALATSSTWSSARPGLPALALGNRLGALAAVLVAEGAQRVVGRAAEGRTAQ